MKRIRCTFTLMLLVSCLLQSAGAVTVRVEQLWEGWNPLFGGNPVPERTVETLGIFDDAGITGSGQEAVAMTYFSKTALLNNNPQNFNVANLADPPSTTMEGNIVAIFQDGVFNRISTVGTGGNAGVGIRDGGSGVNGGFIQIDGFELIWNFPVSGFAEYRLQSTDLVYPQVSAVPLPATVWLLGSALAALLGWCRRSRTRALCQS